MYYFLCGLSVFAAVGTCLRSHSLAETVSSESTNTTSWHDITLNLVVVGHGISYAAWVVLVTQYAVQGSRKLVLPTISFIFFENKQAKNRTHFPFLWHQTDNS
jgi:hypothetical protein